MLKSLNAFFEQYIDWMQSSSKAIKVSFKDIKSIAAMLLVMALIFAIVGFLFHRLLDFYYMFFSINALAIFAFVQYRVKQYNGSKEKPHTHLIRFAILIESIHLVAMLSLFQSLALWIYLFAHVSIFFLILILFISIITNLLTYWIRKKHLQRPTQMISGALWLFVIYASWSHILVIPSPTVMSTVVTLIVLLLFCFKVILKTYEDKKIDDIPSISLTLIVLICMVGVYFLSQLKTYTSSNVTLDMTRAFALLLVVLSLNIKLSLPLFKRGDLI